MIKIIKHGKKVETLVHCVKCDCEFTYEKEDITKIENYSLTSLSIPRYVVYCPDCGNEIQIYNYNDVYPNIPQSPYGGPIITCSNIKEKEY